MQSWLMAVDRVWRHARSWSYIQGSTRNHENAGKTNNLWVLYSVYAVLGVCCTRCRLMIMPWRDREGWLNFVFCDDGWDVDEKERDGGWRSERCGGYERIWEISGTTCLIGLGRPRIGVLHAGSGLIPAVSGMVNWLAHANLLSPSISWWFVPSPLQSPKNTKLSHPSLSLHAMIKSQPGSRSVGWGWEDMIQPGREDPRNCVDPWNRRKSEWEQKMGMIECVFRIDRQSEKKRRKGDQRAICHATRGVDAARGVIHHRGVSDRSDRVRPLWRSHSAWTEMFFADVSKSSVTKAC